MPYTLYDSAAGKDKQEQNAGTSIVTGTITSNCDLPGHGKLLVRIPSLDTEVLARMASPGGGPGAGIQFVHRVGDEVLVALGQNDAADAFILGGAVEHPGPATGVVSGRSREAGHQDRPGEGRPGPPDRDG